MWSGRSGRYIAQDSRSGCERCFGFFRRMSREGLASAKAVCPKTQSGPPRNDTEDHILVTLHFPHTPSIGICQQGETPGARVRMSLAGNPELLLWFGNSRTGGKLSVK